MFLRRGWPLRRVSRAPFVMVVTPIVPAINRLATSLFQDNNLNMSAMSSCNQPETPANKRLHKIREKCPQFRILIIGRANAGKTTILQRVCRTVEDPEIFTPQGEKVHFVLNLEFESTKHHNLDWNVCPSIIRRCPSFSSTQFAHHWLYCIQRGKHDIKNEMIFWSNPGFVFHDSLGFESGSGSELEIVKDFIREYSKKKKLAEQLHAIW